MVTKGKYLSKKLARPLFKSYLCIGFKRIVITGLRKAEATRRKKKMDNNKMISMLKYQLKRYQAMGNGAKCQSLRSQINKLQTIGQFNMAN